MPNLLKSKLGARSLMALAIVLGIFFLFRYTDFRQFTTFQGLVNWVQLARARPLAIGFFYIGFVIGVMFLPITIFPIIGGVLLPFWIAVPLNILAATMGGCLSCLFSRYFGRDLAKKFLRGKFESFDQQASQIGFKAVLVLRLVGIPPFIVSNYALGLSSVNMRDFFWATILGILPWMTFITFLSSRLWDAVLLGGQAGFAHALLVQMRPLLGLSVFVVIFVVVSAYLKKRRTA